MSSENTTGVPRTAVPFGIQDPVEEARAELTAALAAIEEKVNVPKRARRAYGELQVRARRAPVAAALVGVAVAAAAGAAVWAIARALSR